MADSFSQRHNLAGPPPGTVYRDQIPISFRNFLLDYPNQGGNYSPITYVLMQEVIVSVFQVWPNQDPYLDCAQYIKECEWFHVLDIVEGLVLKLAEKNFSTGGHYGFVDYTGTYLSDMNRAFAIHKIGWQFSTHGKIFIRGNENFENTVGTADKLLASQNKPTAAGHLRNAITCLSTRPQPNTAGAVAHSTSAIECVLGEVTGQSGLTFGEYLKTYPNLFHAALKKGLDSLYGYASDGGARHGKEGTQPTFEDAEFVVATCAAVCTLLTRKHGEGQK